MLLSFRAYINAPGQVIVPANPVQYLQVMFNNTSRDTLGWFDKVNGVLRPNASGLLVSRWQVWDQSGVYNLQGYGITAKLIGLDVNGVNKMENGVSQDTAAIGTLGSYANTASSASGGAVHVDAGDTWAIWNYVKNAVPGGGVVIDPNPAHSYWSGEFYPD